MLISEWSIYTAPLPSMPRKHLGKGSKKSVRARGGNCYKKTMMWDTAGKSNIWNHGGCESLHKIYAKTSQTKSQHVNGSGQKLLLLEFWEWEGGAFYFKFIYLFYIPITVSPPSSSHLLSIHFLSNIFILCFCSEKGRTHMGIKKPWHIKLQQD